MTPELRNLFDLGKKHFESRNYARAERCFLKLHRAGSRYADVLNMLGVIYHIEGKFNNAIESFEEALRINPHYAEATLNLAVLYNDLGEYAKAKNLYNRVQKRKTTSDLDPILRGKIANMHAHLGDTYRGVGKFTEAIEEYKKALKLCPTFADIRTKLGISYRENKQTDLSIRELTQTLSQTPSCKGARIQLGITYYITGQKTKAARAWQEVLKQDKNNEVARLYLRLCENGKSKK